MRARRDGPCPCGSGKKYKNCCLRREQREASRLEEHHRAVEHAIQWFESRHPRSLRKAIKDGFLAHLGEQRDRLGDIPDDLIMMVQVNSLEWLLAEGEIETPQGGTIVKRRASEAILGPGGPLLLPGQRAFLEELTKRPLRVYEVVESRPGEGMLLRDSLDPQRGTVTVQERSGSKQLVPWDIFGARIVRVRDHWELSGAVYTLGDSARELVMDLREMLAKLEAETGGDSIRSQRLLSKSIVASWLTLLTARRQPPVLVDQGTGEPLMLVTDHYEVLDWDALAGRLEAEPDVEGSCKEGWTRFVELGDDMRRSLLAINIGKTRDRIEPFARTLTLADDGRAWLERVAGESIRFLIRDVADPMSILERRGSPGSREAPESETCQTKLSPDQLTRFQQDFAEKHYREWADERIPALGDRTPYKAAETGSGREALVNLLKDYESREFRRARQESRDPVDFGFLWAQVGLDRARELALP